MTMLKIPLPQAQRQVFEPRAEGHRMLNRSLLFDRGLPLYEIPETSGSPRRGRSGSDETSKKRVLKSFINRFGKNVCDIQDFEAFLKRRQRALATVGARSVEIASTSRLVAGLGLPHTSETGFLLDRLTGCPYLAGSSVKGLLRSAARLVAEGELAWPPAGDSGGIDGKSFFARHLDRLFGPEIRGDVEARKGELVVYDAFPTDWPRLELDVLNPHGREDELPADTRQPIPVYFLTVAPQTAYRFSFSSRAVGEQKAVDLETTEILLRLALDWLGAGGKTSAGYGSFVSMEPKVTPPPGKAPAVPTTPTGTIEVWESATFLWVRSSKILEARAPQKKAFLKGEEKTAEIRSRLWPSKRAQKQNKPKQARARVERKVDGRYEIVGIEV